MTTPSDVNRSLGNLEGRMSGVEARIERDEQSNAESHRELLVKVEVTNTEVLDAIKDMHKDFNNRIGKLEDTVSVSKAWFKAVKLFIGSLIFILALKFGDAKEAIKEAWKLLF